MDTKTTLIPGDYSSNQVIIGWKVILRKVTDTASLLCQHKKMAVYKNNEETVQKWMLGKKQKTLNIGRTENKA